MLSLFIFHDCRSFSISKTQTFLCLFQNSIHCSNNFCNSLNFNDFNVSINLNSVVYLDCSKKNVHVMNSLTFSHFFSDYSYFFYYFFLLFLSQFILLIDVFILNLKICFFIFFLPLFSISYHVLIQ